MDVGVMVAEPSRRLVCFSCNLAPARHDVLEAHLHAVLQQLRVLALARGDRAMRARAAAECIRARGYRWVGLYDVTASHITAVAWTGTGAPAHPTFPIDQGLNGAAVAAGAPIVVQDVRQDPRYLTTFGQTRAEAIFPVRLGDRGIVGTIDVESDHVGAFSAEDEQFLELCAVALAPLWMDHDSV